MGLVLWIDQNTFATSLLEKVFKKKNLPFYTLSSAADFVYLVEDLEPEVLILDSKTALQDLEALKNQYSGSERLKTLPVIVLDEVPGLDFIEKRIGQINRPFDPFEVPSMIERIVKCN